MPTLGALICFRFFGIFGVGTFGVPTFGALIVWSLGILGVSYFKLIFWVKGLLLACSATWPVSNFALIFLFPKLLIVLFKLAISTSAPTLTFEDLPNSWICLLAEAVSTWGSNLVPLTSLAVFLAAEPIWLNCFIILAVAPLPIALPILPNELFMSSIAFLASSISRLAPLKLPVKASPKAWKPWAIALTAFTTPAAIDTTLVSASTITPMPKATPASVAPPNCPKACPTAESIGASGAAALCNWLNALASGANPAWSPWIAADTVEVIWLKIGPTKLTIDVTTVEISGAIVDTILDIRLITFWTTGATMIKALAKALPIVPIIGANETIALDTAETSVSITGKIALTTLPTVWPMPLNKSLPPKFLSLLNKSPIVVPIFLIVFPILLKAPELLNPVKAWLIALPRLLNKGIMPLTTLPIPSNALPRSIFPNELAIESPILSKLTPSNRSVNWDTQSIPTLETLSKAGCNLLAKVSFIPSIAWPIVLYCVAILLKLAFVPVLAIAARNLSVDTVPACTSLISPRVLVPIDLATAAIPPGACSSISLKSCHCTLGLAAICVACSDKVFIACLGLSADAASPPNPFTSWAVFLVPTAANWA